jgi:hypothetical protein
LGVLRQNQSKLVTQTGVAPCIHSKSHLRLLPKVTDLSGQWKATSRCRHTSKFRPALSSVATSDFISTPALEGFRQLHRGPLKGPKASFLCNAIPLKPKNGLNGPPSDSFHSKLVSLPRSVPQAAKGEAKWSFSCDEPYRCRWSFRCCQRRTRQWLSKGRRH